MGARRNAARPPRRIVLNGKFAAQRTTGVQRVARCLVAALDRALLRGEAAGTEWELLCPPGADPPPLQRIVVRTVGSATAGLHVWEQLALPRAARGDLLISLSGSAPLRAGPQVCSMHDAAVFDHPEAYRPAFVLWYRHLFRRMARHAEFVITPSQDARDRLAAHLKIDAARFAVIRHGSEHLDALQADVSVLDALPRRSRCFLLAVGSANPTKNFAALVEAFRSADLDAGVALVVVGGSNGGVFTGIPLQFIEGRVARLGSVTDAQLKCLYQHAIGLVFPSLYEGFGLPPLEAMRCGCPVAAARATAVTEVCANASLYFDPRSLDDLRTAMNRLVRDPALRESLRMRGLARAALFRWDDAAATLLHHLQQHRLVAA